VRCERSKQGQRTLRLEACCDRFLLAEHLAVWGDTRAPSGPDWLGTRCLCNLENRRLRSSSPLTKANTDEFARKLVTRTFTAQHYNVEAIFHAFHQQATVVAAMGQAIGQLVRQCCRLQTDRTEVSLHNRKRFSN
jgi:hypothetical protein